MNNIQWLLNTLAAADTEIPVPSSYRERVLCVKNILQSDMSGFVNTILDFAIKSALVNYSIETPNKNLTTVFNTWLDNVNDSLRSRIPTGINAVAKEYFRELYKGSSLIAVRTAWEKVDGFILPTKIWLVKGEDVVIEDVDKATKNIGEEKYYILNNINSSTNTTNKTEIKDTDNSMLFIQKPLSSWTDTEPVPFLIQRGIYKNLKLLELIEKKGERLVSKALEYLMLVKKGESKLAELGKPDFIYSKKDLEDFKTHFEQFLSSNKTSNGTPTYVANFDTSIEHLIPDYSKVLSENLYSPVEKRILAGLGLVDITDGISSNRRESILNPKPFISLVNQGIEDFKRLLTDILKTTIEKNKGMHSKYLTNNSIIVRHGVVNQFITSDLRDHLRSAFDRGALSYRTYIELVTGQDFEVEVNRRKYEAEEGIDVDLYPHVVQNQEASTATTEILKDGKTKSKPTDTKTLDDRQGPEAKNFLS